MMHIIVGLFFIALGVWGVFDEWYYVADLVKAGGSLLLCVGGALAMLAGVVGPTARPDDDPADETPLDGEEDRHGNTP